MPLQPEQNSRYWPYLLTDSLYILQEDLNAAAQLQQQAGTSGETSEQDGSGKAAPVQGTTPDATSTPASAENPASDLLWGSLHRGVLILVDYPEHTLMDRPDGLFLVDILKAIGYDFKEVATLNISRCKTRADWDWIEQQSWQKLVSFGVQHPSFPVTLNSSPYELKNDAGRPVICAETLPQIRSDVSCKKRLWNLLKEVFV